MGTFTNESIAYRFKNPSIDGNLDLLTDGAIIKIAADDDLQLTHSGSVGDITCSTGALDINAGTVNIKDEASSETMASFVSDGAVTLNHDNSARLATSSAGVSVTGTLAVSSTSAFTGAITSNAGVIVDNITIDGTEIDLSSGDLTLDVAGDIILDADGADFIFQDAGSEKLRITLDGDHTIIDAEEEIRLDSKFGYFRLRENGTNVGMFDISNAQDFVIRNLVADEDIIFKGTDGSSLITALTLDMSEAGAATFNNLVDATNYKINGAQGSDGQLMTSTGSGVAWEDAAEGGISTGKAIAMAMVFG